MSNNPMLSPVLDNSSCLFNDSDDLQLNYFKSVFQNIAYVAEYGIPEALGHLQRVSSYTGFVAENVLCLPVDKAKRLEISAILHDVGKVAIPRELLIKPELFTMEERLFMQQHTERGFEIISEIEQNFIANDVHYEYELFTLAKEIARYHHENWNGSGYPSGLVQKNIPLSARIVKLVDVIDALISRRSYKEPWSWWAVRDEIKRLENVEFDAIILHEFLEHEAEFLKLAESLGGVTL